MSYVDNSTRKGGILTSKEKEVLRLLSLGLSQRTIERSLHTSSRLISKMRRFCNERNLTFEEAMKLEGKELTDQKIKSERISLARRPDLEYIHSELRKKGVTLKLLHLETKQNQLF